ncbi:MAG TPA: peptidoglycan-binding domain-containing protein [Baekduia sp.]|uniref:peptidoglycan-binding domain-containing protein n=1 Tax=Baekduia sp. TaxID=2600305 RepID=UPI002D766AD5|nr:peptidoglycan-binding domain-containing protein [Baekduia sp.]HET6506474.1 peptidoglycan-binding domain-containing protein [Baekduia sp.]
MPRRRRRLSRSAAALLMACAAAALPASADAANPRAPKLANVRCVPVKASTCRSGVAVRVGKQVQLRGTKLRLGMRVTFRWSKGALATKLHHGKAGWVARVPPGTRPGSVQVTVRDTAGRRSNVMKIRVLEQPKPVTRPATTGGGPLPDAFRGNGMWIWQMEKTEGGNVDAIAARAAAAGITTVYVKAGDGTTPWAQFGPLLIGALRQHGIKACAWQFVYGNSPAGEANVAIAAIQAGADCFVIDAESAYEGKYAAAQKYMTAIRAAVGANYPIGLTSFPYVDYHPGLPFSVFLGPGGAQANLPQVYWKDIGGTVDAISAHTLAHNRIYQTAIAPLGQTYDNPPAADLRRFRQLWSAYGAEGLSWWSWQATDAAHWKVLNEPAPAVTAAEPDPGYPALGKGAKGDEVIWLQEHLTQTYPTVTVTGKYDTATIAAVQALQTTNGIPVTGTTDASTWQAALKLPFVAVDWTATSAKAAAKAAAVHKSELRRQDSAEQ